MKVYAKCSAPIGCVVLALLVSKVMAASRSALHPVESSARQEASLRNLVFPDSLLFSRLTESQIQCARDCVGDESCASFTVSSDSRECRGHSAVMTSDNASRASSGTAYYVMMEDSQDQEEHASSSWLFSECTYSCRGDYTECLDNTCLCYHGIFYSEKSDLCGNTACTQLGSGFHEYPQLFMGATQYHPLQTSTVQSVDQCRTLCLLGDSGPCWTLDYEWDTGLCRLFNVAAIPDSTGLTAAADTDNVSYFQRTCNEPTLV